jgi:four helix bundle protein
MAERSTCGYAPEGAKRRYEAHFVSKLTNGDGLRLVAYASESENGETETWLDFACDCKYLAKYDHEMLTGKRREVGAMLGSMINAPTSFILKSSDV